MLIKIMLDEVFEFSEQGRMTTLYFAHDLLEEAINAQRKLDMGDKIFMAKAVKGVLYIPFDRRNYLTNSILHNFLQLGILDYRNIPQGRDQVVDSFYKNPTEVTNQLSNPQ